MTNNLKFFLILLLSMLPFFLLALANKKASLKKEIRYKQFFMPIVALIYCIVVYIFMNKISDALMAFVDRVVAMLAGFGLQGISDKLAEWVNAYGIYVMLVLFNTAILAAFIILKGIVLPFLIPKAAKIKETNKLVGIFYEHDEQKDKWYIRPHFGQARTFLKTAYYGGFFLSIVAIIVTSYLCNRQLIASPYYPVFALILIGELAFYLDGLRKDEDKSEITAEADNAAHLANYSLLRKPLRKLFGDKLSADGVFMNEEGGGSSSIEDILKEMEEKGGHLGTNYAKFIRYKMETGLKPDPNYVRSGYELSLGKSLLFNTPFYYSLMPYAFYAMNTALLKGGKVLVILGRHGTKEDLQRWCEQGMFSVSNIPGLWKTGELTSGTAEDTEDLDIGIITRSEVHNLDAHKANLKFLRQVTFAVIVEPSKLVTTAQIGLNLLVKTIGTDHPVVYCSVDRNCDGLLDSLSHVLMTNLTEVAATERPKGTSTHMLWTSDEDYLQHRLVPGISRYLGMGTELSFFALKNQIDRAVWYGGEAYPVVDAHWIAKQYYYDLLQYAGLPATQETFDKYFNVSYNMCDEKNRENAYMTVEDELNNLFEVKRDFSTIAENQGFVNVISSEYLLREYMAGNEVLFNTDPKAIPYFAADYARTRRNIILKICLRMCLMGIEEEELQKELLVLDIQNEDPIPVIWEEMCHIFCNEEEPLLDENGIRMIQGPTRKVLFARDKTLEKVRKYTVEKGKFETFYVISDERFNRIILNDLQNANYIAERDTEKVYLGTELKGHIFQKYLPGQMLTLNGKYYELISVTSDNQVILRRASEFIGGRPAYRQVRHYHFRRLEDSESMGALRTVNQIDIHNQFADFSVETPAYWKLKSYQDLKHGKLTEINGIPVRNYYRKQILKLDFSKLGDALTDEVRFTLTALMNEVFRTLFADNQPYIVALTPGEPGLPITYRLDSEEEGLLSEKAIYIVEDSQLDVGLLVSVERNLDRILEIIADYLRWNDEMITESREKEKERLNPQKAVLLEIPADEEKTGEAEEGKKKGFWARLKVWFKKIGQKIKGIFKRKKKAETAEEVPPQENEAQEPETEIIPEEVPEELPQEAEAPAEEVIEDAEAAAEEQPEEAETAAEEVLEGAETAVEETLEGAETAVEETPEGVEAAAEEPVKMEEAQAEVKSDDGI